MQKEFPQIFILILNWKNKEDTIKCVTSVKKINYPAFSTVLIDNGSEDGSVETFQELFPEITLLRNDKNLGYAEGNNVGIKYAIGKGADFILILNNDALVDPNILHAFVEASKDNPDGGIFGAKVLNQNNEMYHFGGMWDARKCEFKTILCAQKYKQVDYVCGCSFFIRRKVVETIGYFEPKFFLLWEESDYCFRAKQHFFLTYSVQDAIISHKISASFDGGKPQMHYFWWRNRLFWISRNASKKEKMAAYKKVLLPEIFKIYKLRYLKSLELFLFKRFLPKDKVEKKSMKLKRYKAGCLGIRDYYLNRFGNTYKKV
ncbi:MAG: glycosyltransferase family 2 protein [Chlamydiota bacterium]|jgi:GT2 family glycosyltransferase